MQGSEEEKAAAIDALVAVLETIRIAAVLLHPVVPRLASRVLEQLGLDASGLRWSDAAWGGLAAGQELRRPEPVFSRIQRDFVTEPARGGAHDRAAA